MKIIAILSIAFFCKTFAISRVLFNCKNVTSIPSEQCEVLKDLFISTNGDGWIRNEKWLIGTDPCFWNGIVCRDGKISEINLSENNLKGNVPSSLGFVYSLEKLALHGNFIEGTIPEQFVNFARITELYLHSNNLSGPIPHEIGRLSNLQFLYLHKNNITGFIPRGIGALRNLQHLYLYENNIFGSIPDEIGSMESLNSLYISSNNLSGAIPKTIAGMNKLRELGLHNNKISGIIPREIGNLQNLVYLFLDDNKLSGSIPEEIGNLEYLERFTLGNNAIKGEIPKNISKLLYLQDLKLHENKISGTIPLEIGNLTSLKILWLHENILMGSLPETIGYLEDLQQISLFSNINLNESIPHSFINLKVEWFSFSNTSICEPNNKLFQSWIRGIEKVYSSNIRCIETIELLNGSEEASCIGFFDCDSSLVCRAKTFSAPNSKACLPPLRKGERCSSLLFECDLGLVCRSFDISDMSKKKCLPFAKRGELCDTNFSCQGSLVCRPLTSESNLRFCLELGAEKDPCNVDEDCSSLLTCRFNSMFEKRCVSSSFAKGKNCRRTTDCMDDLVCRPFSPGLFEYFTCQDPGKIQDLCKFDEDCEDNLICRPKTLPLKHPFYCLGKSESGETCSTHEDCLGKLICGRLWSADLPAICLPHNANPITCSSFKDCPSRSSCTENFCFLQHASSIQDSNNELGNNLITYPTVPPFEGLNFNENCDFDHECKGNLYCRQASMKSKKDTKCLPIGQEMELCTQSSISNKHCENNLVCRISTKWKTENDNSTYCQSIGISGDSCSYDSDCKGKLICNTEIYENSQFGICIEHGKEPNPCSSNEDCMSPEICKHNFCVSEQSESRKITPSPTISASASPTAASSPRMQLLSPSDPSKSPSISTVSFGEKCNSTENCVDDLVCRVDKDSGSERICTVVGIPGSRCEKNEDCLLNLKCVSLECTNFDIGFTCGKGDNEKCISENLYCAFSENSEKSLCQERLQFGGKCSDENECIATLRCIDGICAECSGNSDCPLSTDRCEQNRCLALKECSESDQVCEFCRLIEAIK